MDIYENFDFVQTMTIIKYCVAGCLVCLTIIAVATIMNMKK